MQLTDTDTMTGFFKIVGGTDRSQAATMNLDPGQSTGGPTNSHSASDQWLFVTDGRGEAVIEGERVTLTPGVLYSAYRGRRDPRNLGCREQSPPHDKCLRPARILKIV